MKSLVSEINSYCTHLVDFHCSQNEAWDVFEDDQAKKNVRNDQYGGKAYHHQRNESDNSENAVAVVFEPPAGSWFEVAVEKIQLELKAWNLPRIHALQRPINVKYHHINP